MRSVMQRSGMKVVECLRAAPRDFRVVPAMYGCPNESGWSSPVSLGEKSIEGLRRRGTQKTYTVAAGAVGNEKAVTSRRGTSPIWA